MRIPATIVDIRQGTPTTKSFELDLGGHDFSFSAGQWVDCYAEVDGRLEVAGFSMTSSPLTKGTIRLAVKLVGENPVTHFLHKGAEVGTVVHVDGGQGDFYYRRGMGDSLVLIAGGIGLTPLMSIVRYIDEAEPDVSATLVYSASTPSELIFREELNEIARNTENMRCLFTVTRPGDESWSGRVGRVDGAMLREAGVNAGSLCYVSGPPPMIRDVVTLLRGLGVPDLRIKYEWWE